MKLVANLESSDYKQSTVFQGLLISLIEKLLRVRNALAVLALQELSHALVTSRSWT